MLTLAGSPVLNYSGINSDTLTVALAGGEDTLEVVGNETSETITVSGTAVVASNLSSHPEVAGDAAVLVDPTDAEAIGSALEKLIEDDVILASFPKCC